MNAPKARLIPKTQPERDKDDTAEKKAPIVQPIPSVAEYPIKTPPEIDCKYLFGSLGVLILNSLDSKAATKAPKKIPIVKRNHKNLSY